MRSQAAISNIVRRFCALTGVPLDYLRGPARHEPLACYRHTLCALLAESGARYCEIARAVNRTWKAVQHGTLRVKNELETRGPMSKEIIQLKKLMQNEANNTNDNITEAKRGRGRPRRFEEQTVTLSVRIPASRKIAYLEVANKRGLSLTDLVMDALDRIAIESK